MRIVVIVTNLLMVTLVLSYMLSCGHSTPNAEVATVATTAFGSAPVPTTPSRDGSARAIAPGADDDLARYSIKPVEVDGEDSTGKGKDRQDKPAKDRTRN